MSVVLSTNKSDFHEIAEIVLKVALNTITVNIVSCIFRIVRVKRVSFVCVRIVNLYDSTFNNISVISWRSVLMVGETVGPGESHRPATKSLTNCIT